MKIHGCNLHIRDDDMKTPTRNPAMRQGKFLWMNEQSKKNYISLVKKRIADGYYFSEKIIIRIVDDIAPVFDDTVEHNEIIG